MLSFLFALRRRLHQPTGLAVAVTPLALLACCALAMQALGSAEQPSLQTPAIVPHGDYRASDSSAGQWQVVHATVVAADNAACCVPKAARPVGKSQLDRRITERWAPSLLVGLRAVAVDPSFVAGPLPPWVFDASSPEYLILRQLRL